MVKQRATITIFRRERRRAFSFFVIDREVSVSGAAGPNVAESVVGPSEPASMAEGAGATEETVAGASGAAAGSGGGVGIGVERDSSAGTTELGGG